MTIDEYTDACNICKKCRFKHNKQCDGHDSDKIHCYYYLNEMLPEIEKVQYARWVDDVYCSNCGRFPVDVVDSISNRELTKYFGRCPHCGAHIKGEYT